MIIYVGGSNELLLRLLLLADLFTFSIVLYQFYVGSRTPICYLNLILGPTAIAVGLYVIFGG